MAVGGSTRVKQTPPPKERASPPEPDTPTGLQRYLPRILFPFDRAGTGDEWLAQTARVREVGYENASTIDWSYEESRERIRVQALRELQGLKGVTARLWDSTIPWLVVVATGLGTGAVASCLDILSAWLSDLRMGVCRDTWWMSRNVCCMGLDRGSSCFGAPTPRPSLLRTHFGSWRSMQRLEGVGRDSREQGTHRYPCLVPVQRLHGPCGENHRFEETSAMLTSDVDRSSSQ